MKYRREIDGLRAIAVGAVVVFHSAAALAPGGYIGVDIFFVISGYLITRILIGDLAEDKFSILTFYERRLRRIAPALVVVTALTLILSLRFLNLSESLEVFESAAATALFIANLRFWWKTDYFGTAAEDRPLLHMWSLAVEEQFYLVFPIVLFLLWKSRKSALLSSFVILGVISMGVAEYLSRTAPMMNFFLPMGRAWELLMGCIAAVLHHRSPPRKTPRGEMLALCGLALIVVPIFTYDKFTPTPSLWTFAPVLGTFFIIHYAVDGTRAARLLGWRPFVWLGLISYSVYLYHQPILAFARINLTPEWRTPATMLGFGLLSLPLGYLSWRFIEQPFRKGFKRWQIFTWSGASLTAIALLGVMAHFRPQPIEALYVAGLSPEARENYDRIQRATATADAYEINLGGGCRFRGNHADADFEARYDACLAQHGPGILVIGGSHAGDLHGVLATASEAPFIMSLTKGFCRPHRRLAGPPPHECHYDSIADFLSRRGDDVARVVYTQAFFTLFDDYHDTRSAKGFHPELVSETVGYLKRISAYAPVTMVGPKRGLLPILPSRLSPRGGGLVDQMRAAYSPDLTEAEDLVDRSFAQALDGSGIEYVSLMDLLPITMPDDLIVDGELTFHDSNHLGAVGERHYGALLAKTLKDSPLDLSRDLAPLH